MRARLRLLCLLLAALLPTSCQGPPLRIGNVVVLGVSPYGVGEEIVTYGASLFNDGTSDVEGAWAMIVGPVEGATVLDGYLVFGPTPAGGANAEGRFVVRRPVGSPFDPATLGWAIVSGVFDADADGLPDGQELDLGLANDRPDTDGDGAGDGAEARFGTRPDDPFHRPSGFPAGTFFAMGERRDGEPALALADGWLAPPPLFLGRPGAGSAGLAVDRHGFLFLARGRELLRIHPLTGVVERTVTLRHAGGEPAHVTSIAFDPADNALYGVANDPASGAPTAALLAIDAATGLVAPAGPPLPLAPVRIAFHPEVDPEHGYRRLFLLPEGALGESSFRVVRFPDGAVSSWFHGRGAIDSMAFDEDGLLVTSRRIGPTSTEVFGGSFIDGVFERALTGLAVPPACPVPCFLAPKLASFTEPLSIALADLDGDGFLDGVASIAASDALAVLRNDSTGDLVAEAVLPLPDRGGPVVVAGFDADAALDAAVLTEAGELHLLRGDGSGGLGPAELAGSMPAGDVLIAADVTGDGAPDLLARDAVLVNDGAGGFAPGPAHPFGDARGAIAVGDVDGDGQPEVIVLAPGAVVAFEPDGAGGFVESARQPLDFEPASLAAGDVDGDGRADTVVSARYDTRLELLRGSAGGLTAPETLPVAPSFALSSTSAPAIGDLTRDGVGEIVVGGCESLHVLVGERNGLPRPALFTSGGSSCGRAPAIADLNGDGLQDVAFADGVLVVLRTALRGPPGP